MTDNVKMVLKTLGMCVWIDFNWLWEGSIQHCKWWNELWVI